MFNSRGIGFGCPDKKLGGEGWVDAGGGVTSVRTSNNQPLTRYCDERLLPTAADSLLDTASGLWDVDAVSNRGGGGANDLSVKGAFHSFYI